MSEAKNVEVLKQAYQYWNDNKEQAFEHWMELVSDDVNFKSLADGAPGMEFTRRCECKEDLRRYFLELAAEWEMIHYTVDEYIAQGDRVVAVGSCGWRHRATGKEIDSPKADIVRMRESKIIEFFEFYDTAKIVAVTQA
ncbi:MAG: nuclear transport factor 2 family protein [Gammaproteobacteria bacterium]|nr:nuclear transport factor 2 family protein [Gammaproteobacteria bacterium]